MTREQVWETVSSLLVRDFGRLLEVRDVRRIRRVMGEGWMVTVVLHASSGELHVADIVIDESGAMSPRIDADTIILAIKRASTEAPPPASESMGDLGEFGAGDDEGDALEALEMNEDPADVLAARAIEKGDPVSLRQARELLPRLLADHEKRGTTLLTMAEVEMKLGEPSLAKGYLEAGSRELGDRFDMPALERCASVALELYGKEGYARSAIHALLEESRARLKPLRDFMESRSFAGLPAALRAAIEPHLSLGTLAPGEDLVKEGEPSRNVYVVRSGLLGVWLEKPSGGKWLVRCCFPGWLVGESSVLQENARCTATLRAERVSEVWTIPAGAMRAAMSAFPELADRLASTKQIHRIDSFFSMHETMGQLDVQVRDEMLSCLQRLETFEKETTLLPANEAPKVACLVARGEVLLLEPGKRAPVGSIGADGFYGVRDSIHGIASGVQAIARPGTTVAFFDADRLRALCLRSPAHVVAVLERLG
jgi:CRP-like cAMP-binding protein